MTRKFELVLVEYEESDGDYRAVMRFDHEPRGDGVWHLLHSSSHSLYRIEDGHFQWRNRVDGASEVAAQELWDFTGGLEPIAVGEGSLEIFLGRDEEEYFAREYAGQTDRPRAAGMSELTRAEFLRARDAIDAID